MMKKYNYDLKFTVLITANLMALNNSYQSDQFKRN